MVGLEQSLQSQGLLMRLTEVGFRQEQEKQEEQTQCENAEDGVQWVTDYT